MAGQAFSITVIGGKELHRRLDRAADGRIVKWAKKEIEPVADATKKGIQERIEKAPRVDRGTLLKGMRSKDRSSHVRAEFVIHPGKTADRYAIFVEKDTRPHWAPRAALQGWADRHNIPVYAVLWKIAREGTTGIHMFEEEWKEVKGQGKRLATKIGQRILIEFSRG